VWRPSFLQARSQAWSERNNAARAAPHERSRRAGAARPGARGRPTLPPVSRKLVGLRIALFIACFNDTLFPATGRAVVRLLERLGHTVDFPLGQTCCGQLHLNSGYPDEAAVLARRFVRVFAGCDVVVSPSASCVGTVREQYSRLAERAGDRALAEEAAALAPRVLELTELLVDRLAVEDVGARFEQRVAYHPTCHSLRGLRLGDRPLRLLRAVRGLELVELRDAEECCGFGGTFAVKNAAVSAAMLADKLERLRAGGAEVCTAVDNSCLLQIGGGLRRAGSPMRALHLADILADRASP
jgi:L-lactate dehydrogenase complex protein LldE